MFIEKRRPPLYPHRCSRQKAKGKSEKDKAKRQKDKGKRKRIAVGGSPSEGMFIRADRQLLIKDANSEAEAKEKRKAFSSSW
jgi:hypothetical protein